MGTPINSDGYRHSSVRLRGYDYTQAGYYFVTIVTHTRECLLGRINGDIVEPTPIGEMVVREWQRLPHRFIQVEVDQWVMMPNHLHGIIIIHDPKGDKGDSRNIVLSRSHVPTVEKYGVPVAGSIPTIIRSFKSSTTQRFRWMTGESYRVLWQRNFFEHIIRHDEEFEKIQAYIIDNPRRWIEDVENPGLRSGTGLLP